MQDIERQKIFAPLTEQFEDCAALAAEDQRFGLSREEVIVLPREIKNTTKAAQQSLFLAEQCLDDFR